MRKEEGKQQEARKDNNQSKNKKRKGKDRKNANFLNITPLFLFLHRLQRQQPKLYVLSGFTGETFTDKERNMKTLKYLPTTLPWPSRRTNTPSQLGHKTSRNVQLTAEYYHVSKPPCTAGRKVCSVESIYIRIVSTPAGSMWAVFLLSSSFFLLLLYFLLLFFSNSSFFFLLLLLLYFLFLLLLFFSPLYFCSFSASS